MPEQPSERTLQILVNNESDTAMEIAIRNRQWTIIDAPTKESTRNYSAKDFLVHLATTLRDNPLPSYPIDETLRAIRNVQDKLMKHPDYELKNGTTKLRAILDHQVQTSKQQCVL